jgi:hypothetical protein
MVGGYNLSTESWERLCFYNAESVDVATANIGISYRDRLYIISLCSTISKSCYGYLGW